MQTFLGKPQRFAKRPDVLLNQSGIEAVVPRGHRSVRGEHNFAGDSRNGGVKRDAFILHPHADRFQHGERAVAFVQMKHARRNPQGFQGAQSAHAQQQLLANADAQIAAIQPRGQFAILGSIAFHIGIEQQQVAASHFHAPDFGVQPPAAGFDFDYDRPAILSDRHFHRPSD